MCLVVINRTIGTCRLSFEAVSTVLWLVDLPTRRESFHLIRQMIIPNGMSVIQGLSGHKRKRGVKQLLEAGNMWGAGVCCGSIAGLSVARSLPPCLS